MYEDDAKMYKILTFPSHHVQTIATEACYAESQQMVIPSFQHHDSMIINVMSI